MTLRIERGREGERTMISLIGRVGVEHLDELKGQISTGASALILDLEEVNLVDVEAVRFLVSLERLGTEVRNASPYIREWMSRVRGGKS